MKLINKIRITMLVIAIIITITNILPPIFFGGLLIAIMFSVGLIEDE